MQALRGRRCGSCRERTLRFSSNAAGAFSAAAAAGAARVRACAPARTQTTTNDDEDGQRTTTDRTTTNTRNRYYRHTRKMLRTARRRLSPGREIKRAEERPVFVVILVLFFYFFLSLALYTRTQFNSSARLLFTGHEEILPACTCFNDFFFSSLDVYVLQLSENLWVSCVCVFIDIAIG